MNAYLAKIIKGMTAKQRDAVLATADAEDGRVPYTVHQRTVDALYRKRLIREVTNRNGGFNWCVLTYNGKRVAEILANRNSPVAALLNEEPAAAAPDATPEPVIAGTMLRDALSPYGITPVADEFSYAVSLAPGTAPADVLDGLHLVVAGRGPSIEHTAQTHTGWIVDLYDRDGAPVDTRPFYSSGDGTALVDCLTDSAAAAAVIANFLPGTLPGAVLGATLAVRGIPFHLEADPAWGQLLVVDLDRFGGTGTLEIADRGSSLFHPVEEHTGWSIFRKDTDGEFVPNSVAPVFISGDGETTVDLFEDTENAIEFIENVAFRQ